MTTNDQLIEILDDLSKVLKTIKNDANGIIPQLHHSNLKAAILDCLYAIKITRDQIYNEVNLPKNSNNDPNSKAMFDAGLSSKAQMDFKYGLIKDLYNQLSECIYIENAENDSVSNVLKEYNDHYGPQLDPNFHVPSSYSNDINTPFTWISKMRNKMIPRLKKYLGVSRTMVSSIAKVYGVQEKVSEVLGMINVGITMSEEAHDLLNKS